MKRILVVLLLLAVAAMGFSVSGKVYTRIVATGVAATPGSYYNSEPWVCWKETPLGDLRVGRAGTGVSMNFDSFTLDYKWRRPIQNSDPGTGSWTSTRLWGLYDVLDNYGDLTLTATSPGYIKLSGLKLGGVDLSIGGSWWTLQETRDVQNSNTVITNLKSIGYNCFAVDATYSIQAGDLHIWAAPWNQINFAYFMGSDKVQNLSAAVTNEGTTSGYGLVLPCNIDYSMEALSVGVEFKLFMTGVTVNTKTLTATNAIVQSGLEVGAVLKLAYVINELAGVFADVGIVMYGGSTSEKTLAVTNLSTTSGMMAPILAGLTLTPAPAFTLNLGAGLALMIDNKVKTENSDGTTNEAFTDTRVQTEWDNYEMHAYHKPLIKFAADTKFAGDFGAGLTFVTYLNDTMGTGNNGGNTDLNSHDKYGYVKRSNWLNFSNLPDWDGLGGSSAYLSYAKDNFETKLVVNSTGSLLGLFGAIEVGVKF